MDSQVYNNVPFSTGFCLGKEQRWGAVLSAGGSPPPQLPPPAQRTMAGTAGKQPKSHNPVSHAVL